MTERPILFSPGMVRAILEDRKTQTRRIAKFEPLEDGLNLSFSGLSVQRMKNARTGWSLSSPDGSGANAQRTLWTLCPHGEVDDRLWVRENGWQPCEPTLQQLRDGADTWPKYWYDADGVTENDREDFKRWGWKRRPSIHMPRRFSRITLEITGVRVERLRDISETDAKGEGVSARNPDSDTEHDFNARISLLLKGYYTAKYAYAELWDQINGAGSWAANPWVWVVEFRRLA